MSGPRSIAASLALAAGALAAPAAAQRAPAVDSVTQAGVLRATAVVDSVFVDRNADAGFVGAGDWASYLMARLGVIPIPHDLKVQVIGDTARVRLMSHVGDLPEEARRALGPMVYLLSPDAELVAHVTLQALGPEVVRFHLEAVRVNGAQFPEPLLQTVMAEVGRQYPALSRSGRDLLVAIPAGAAVALAEGGVRLKGP